MAKDPKLRSDTVVVLPLDGVPRIDDTAKSADAPSAAVLPESLCAHLAAIIQDDLSDDEMEALIKQNTSS